MAVSFEIQHGVYHMLQHSGACHHAFLRHMSDNEYRDSLLLSQPHENPGSLAYLGDTSGCGSHLLAVHGLNGIDNNNPRLFPSDHPGDQIQIRLAQQRQPFRKASHTLRPHLDLLQGFLAGDIQHISAPGQLLAHLQQQCGLADSRISAHQYQGAGDDSAAQHTIKLRESRTHSLLLLESDL